MTKQPNNSSSTLNKRGIVLLTNEFIQTLSARIVLIEKGFRSGDYSIAINESHKLKGVAGTYGFPEISEQCQKIEVNLREKHYQQIDSFLEILTILIDDALKKVVPEK